MHRQLFRRLRATAQWFFISTDGVQSRPKHEVCMFDYAKFIQEEFPHVFDLVQERQNEYENAHMGRSHPRELYRQLRRMNVACEWIGNSCIASSGGTSFHMRGTTNGLNGNRARAACKDKSQTKRILSENGFNVPRGHVYPSDQMPAEIELPFPFPIVLKPLDGNQGVGVCTNITSYDDIRSYWQTVPKGKSVLMEEFVIGLDLRCSVVDGKLVAAASRVNAHVFGDGVSTIAELIRTKEEVRARNPDTHGQELVVDPPRDLNVVPKSGEMVILNPLMNMASGGDSVNVTPFLSAEVRHAIEDAVACVEEANYIGIDILARSFTDASKLVFIEMNTSASFMMHKFPCYGEPIEVGEAIARYMKKRLFSDPLSREKIKEIAERNKENPDVQVLIWELERLRNLDHTPEIEGGVSIKKTSYAEFIPENSVPQQH